MTLIRGGRSWMPVDSVNRWLSLNQNFVVDGGAAGGGGGAGTDHN